MHVSSVKMRFCDELENFEILILDCCWLIFLAHAQLVGHSESADLHQSCVIFFRCLCQVAALYLVEVCHISQW